MPKSSEFVVLVKVKIDILNEFSKFIAFKDKSTDKIKRLKKNEIKIKKEFLVFSLSIFLLELKIFWFITLLGLINFSISEEVVFTKIQILINFIPDVLDINEPPIIVNNKK